MNKDEKDMADELRSEYDLRSLRVRKVGPARQQNFEQVTVCLEPDVAEMFPDSESVNEALRFLMRITKENKPNLRNIETATTEEVKPS